MEIHDNVIGLCKFGHDGEDSCGWGPALHIKTTMSRGGAIENITFRDNIVYNTSSFILLDMGYQQGENNPKPPKDYQATTVRGITFVGNRAMGLAMGASFECFSHDACQDITVVNNTVKHATTSPWSCNFIKSFYVSGNEPSGLEDCMANSMNGTTQWSKAIQ